MGTLLRDIFHNSTHRGCHLLAIFYPRTRHKEPAPYVAAEPEEKGEEGEEEEGDDEGQHGARAGEHGET